jgi:hypothetical protein
MSIVTEGRCSPRAALQKGNVWIKSRCFTAVTILDYGSTNDRVNVYYEVYSPYYRLVTIYRGSISGGNFIVTP